MPVVFSNCTVHDKLYHRHTFKPILAFIGKSTNHLLNRSILTFGLPISLWMVSTTKNNVCVHVPIMLHSAFQNNAVKCMSLSFITYLGTPKNLTQFSKKQLGHFRCSELVFPLPCRVLALTTCPSYQELP